MLTRRGASSVARRSGRALMLGLALLSMPGCREAGPTLIIATDLPAEEVREIGRAFAVWCRARPDLAPPTPRITWVRTAPGVDPLGTIAEGLAADVVLGGSPASCARLAAAAFLGPGSPGTPAGDPAPWWMARRADVGLVRNPQVFADRALAPLEGWDALDDPRLAGLIALDDPRRDPVTFALASARLEAGAWGEGYAALVRAAGRARPIGRVGGSALARLRRGGAAIAPAIVEDSGSSGPFPATPLGPGPALAVGVARDTRRHEAARIFVQFLDERYDLAPGSTQAALEQDLLADLLGAILVDAQDELVGAVRVLAESFSPRLEAFLVEPPPWPPASVQELAKADPSGGLVEALADQVAPVLETRTWLLNSWDEPSRPIDGQRLADLAGAVGGALAAEPRFRAWLRAEWTAWARQRYRRVARQALADRAASATSPAPGGVP